MIIGITTYRLNEFPRFLIMTEQCIESVLSQTTSFPFSLIVSDQRSNILVRRYLTKKFDIEVIHEENNCVSRSWNLICQRTFQENQYCLILNNDIKLDVGVLEGLPRFAKNHPRSIITSTEGFGFSAFLISKAIYNEIGPFDENLKGGTLEDWDYTARAEEKNISIIQCPTFKVQHKRSSTKNAVGNLDEILLLQEDSKIYYRQKWGDGKHKLP